MVLFLGVAVSYGEEINRKDYRRPQVMSGHPCIRGMRVTISNILRLLASHHSYQRILEAYPYLEAADIDACLQYAALLADDREIEMVA